jgi:CDP-diacylglycerol--glycerol-3-phosphate 3-phosphatidyltransferase
VKTLYAVASLTPAWVTPNHLSWLRIWIIPFLWLVYLAHPVLAVLLYAFACITDWLDGHLARTRGQTTPTGKRLDEVSDKILAGGVLALLFANGTIPFDASSGLFWFVVVIVLRECVVTTFREIWPERAGQIPSIKAAKYKTGVMMVGFGILLLAGMPQPFGTGAVYLGSLLTFIATFLALWSGWSYFWLFLRA